MRILVTGGAGFIGSAVCRLLVLQKNATVLNLDVLSYAANKKAVAMLEGNASYHFIKADVCDSKAVASAFKNFQPDAVMHLAAETHVDRSIDAPAPFITTNMVGTFTMLEAARHYWKSLTPEKRAVFRFVHVSTDEVFGSLPESGLFNEHSPYDPSSPYSASKAGADQLVTAWNRTYGLPTLTVNCSNCYGPYQWPEKLIPLMTLAALNKKPMPLYGDGKNVRDWLFVEDAAQAMCAVLEKGKTGERYVIGGRNEHTNYFIVHEICRIMDALRPGDAPHSNLITYVKDRPGHDRRYGIDPTKISNDLGWQAQTSFKEGLEKTVCWYEAHKEWWEAEHDPMQPVTAASFRT